MEKGAFKDRVCVITGVSGGLGRAVTTRFLEAGAIVVGLARQRPGQLTGEYTGRWIFKKADASDNKQVVTVFRQIGKELGRIDALINLIGGIYPWSNLNEVALETWERTFAVNLTGTYLCCREALKIMIPQNSGSIVNVGALAALRGGAQAGPYGAAKAAVINLTETVAEENKAHNIRANVIVPGIIDTPANREAMPDADTSRWVRPEALAEVLLFLASDNSAPINGSIIRVTGKF
jgi:NAD(P)-dependent dehydrogenase (short-subunit alcohol dehydrogenase family)